MFIIPDLLDTAQLREIRTLLAEARFSDGRQTAGPGSRNVKNNLQGDPSDERIQQVQRQVHERLTGHPQYRILAVPRIVRPMTINRYDEGMFYGDHMDHPLLAGDPPARGDVSTTVFFSAPDEYEGGELVVNSQSGEPRTFKLPPGHAVCYPAGTLHRVNPVTRGSRLAAVTVAESRIQDVTRRELFSDVSQITRWVQDVAADTPQERLANKVYNNLMRLWCQP
ncbi:Fe2+-dependent dioxygenase [Elongatibacter sediminis]|uniref:Fe2+-dependent dioxygenase n=1 Tax=Elongatibacter sediminis TaxID=3119006 RepID=A0AAW9R846_9GAMM